MNLILYNSSGKKKKIYQNEDSAFSGRSFHLLPISTDRKGPVYTLVDDKFIHTHKKSQDDIKMVFEIDFGHYGSYRSNPAHIFVPPSTGLSHYANLMPLVFQIFMMGNWLQISDSIHYIDISNIDVSVDNAISHVNCDNGSFDHTRESFRKLNLETSCKKVFGSILEWAEGGRSVILLEKGNRWRYSSIDAAYNEVFKYILIPIAGAESLYLLSFKEFQIFSMINIMCVGTSVGDFSGTDAGFGIFSSDIVEVLESCLFFPQLLLMLDKIYGYRYGWEVKFSLNDSMSEYHLSAELDIVKKDQCRSTSLFYILKKFICYLRDIKEE